MTRIAEIADRLRRLAKRREMEGIYTDSGLCEEAAAILVAIGAGGQAVAGETEWHRADGVESILLYTLVQDGWRKGDPVMVNDIMVRIEAANGSETPIEPIANRILSALSQPHPANERVVEALPKWAGWRSIDTALEDCRVILATAGNWVGEAIMLRDEDTGEQVWTWVDTGKRVRHSCYGWMPLPEHIDAPVLSDLRPDGSDGPTGAE